MLFALGDVAAILRSHVPLFLADLAVVTVQARGLCVRHLALPHFAMDAAILVREALVDLFAARMRVLPRRVGESGAGRTDISVAAIARGRIRARMMFLLSLRIRIVGA